MNANKSFSYSIISSIYKTKSCFVFLVYIIYRPWVKVTNKYSLRYLAYFMSKEAHIRICVTFDIPWAIFRRQQIFDCQRRAIYHDINEQIDCRRNGQTFSGFERLFIPSLNIYSLKHFNIRRCHAFLGKR